MNTVYKLVIVEPFCPLPSNSGGKTRILNTLCELNKTHPFKLLSFFQSKDEIVETNSLSSKLNISCQYFPLQNKRLFSFILNGIPHWFSPWYSPELIKTVKQLSPNKILIETTQLLYLIKYLKPKTYKVFTAFDVSTVSFWRRMLEEPVYKIPLHLIRLLEVYLYEKKYLHLFDKVIAVSHHDAQIIRKYFYCQNVVVIPNGIKKIDFLNTKSSNTIKIGFIGSPNHKPSTNAVSFLLEKIIPVLENRNIKHKVILAGIQENGPKHTNVTYLPYLSNVRNFYQQIDILMAPIFSGSGSRIKILESLSFGKPVITTAIGAEGLGITTPYLSIINPRFQSNPTQWVEHLLKIKANLPEISLHQIKLTKQLKPILWKNLIQKMSNFL